MRVNLRLKAVFVISAAWLIGCGGGSGPAEVRQDNEARKRALDFYNEGKLLDKDERTVNLAIQSYSEALRWWPDFADAYAQRGKLLARQGKSREAEADLVRAIQLAPDQPVYYNNRAVFYKDTGRPNEAELDFNKAMSFSDLTGPEKAHFLMNRAALYWTMGRIEEALLDYQAVLKHKPDLATQREISKYIMEIKAEQKKQNPPGKKK